ncbi:hypothetical protein A9Q91_01195 [Candidatus Gracilibacteria bacterium 28_42_T64]|nr:hypothetical protein A9Q91_01195 [Candidatus Gracilibacteria bacterium 28_42_T64]
MHHSTPTLVEQNQNKLEKHSKLLSNYGKVAEVVRTKLDKITDFRSPRYIEDLWEQIPKTSPDIELITNEIVRYTCERYSYPYSNDVLFALGETRSHLNFRIRSESMIFSDLLKDHKIISGKKAGEGDIIVYFNQEDDIMTAEGDRGYSHIGKVCEDGRIISQFGEQYLGVYKHKVPHVFTSYGDSIVFMRKQ